MQELDKRHILDYDGMGDFSRFPRKTTEEYVSLENEIKSSFEKLIQIFVSDSKSTMRES